MLILLQPTTSRQRSFSPPPLPCQRFKGLNHPENSIQLFLWFCFYPFWSRQGKVCERWPGANWGQMGAFHWKQLLFTIVASLPIQAPRRPFTQIPFARCICIPAFLLIFSFTIRFLHFNPERGVVSPEGGDRKHRWRWSGFIPNWTTTSLKSLCAGLLTYFNLDLRADVKSRVASKVHRHIT